MSNFYLTSDTNFPDWIDANAGYDSADQVIIQEGAVVTIDRSPASALGNFLIDDGQLLIDGANATDPIHIWGLKQKSWFPAGSHGKFVSTVGWYTHATTGDGTANQSVDWTDYWTGGGDPGDFADVLIGIWMEDTVQVTYTGESGTTPTVGQWVELSGTPTTYGKVHAIDTSAKTIQIEGWAGEITNGTVLEVRMLGDDEGPQVTKGWTATTSGSESLVAGVWTPMARLNTTNDAAPTSAGYVAQSGQGFLIDEFGTDMTFPYRVPRNGAHFRAPMITIGTVNSEGNFNSSTPRALDNNENNRFDFAGTNAGTAEVRGINFGSGFAGVASMGQFIYEYCAMTGAGGQGLGKQMEMYNCIVAEDMKGAVLKGTKLGSADTLSGNKIHDSLLVMGAAETTSCYQFATSNNLDFRRNKWLSSHSNAGSDVTIKFTTVTDIEIHNNDFIGTGCQFSRGVNVNFISNRMSYNVDGGLSTSTNTNAVSVEFLSGCDNVLVKDLQIATMPGGRVLNITDSSNITVRCVNSPDYPLPMNTNRIAGPFLVNGAWSNVDVARVYLDSAVTGSGNTTANRSFQIIKTGTTLAITNFYGCYDGEFEPSCTALTCKSYRGGGDGGLNTTGGMEVDNLNVYGNLFFSTFSSATTGNLCFSYRDVDATSAGQVSVSGDYFWDRKGKLGLYDGTTFSYEMAEFAKGHTGFTGDITFNHSNNASHGSNQIDANCLMDFQYDIGSGWNGSWLNAGTPANLTNITIDPDVGVKVKWRLTNNDGVLREYNGLLIETTTTASAQQVLYPIDQNFVDFTLTGLQANTEVRVYSTGTTTELFGVENSGTTFTDQYLHTGSDFGVDIVIHHQQYEAIRLENVILTATAASIPIQQQFDRQYANP